MDTIIITDAPEFNYDIDLENKVIDLTMRKLKVKYLDRDDPRNKILAEARRLAREMIAKINQMCG